MQSQPPNSASIAEGEAEPLDHSQIESFRKTPSYGVQRFRPVAIDPSAPAPRWDRGYLVSSTAPNNVEDGPSRSARQPPGLAPSLRLEEGKGALQEGNRQVLRELAGALHAGGADPEIIIAVHGFSNNLQAAVHWYSDIYNHLARHPVLAQRNLVFLGYRWPSERPLDPLRRSLRGAVQALPRLPQGLLALGASLALALLIGARFFPSLASGLFAAAVLPLLLVGLLVALVVERLVVYFRDGYRASYFATPDLVDFIRDLDDALWQEEITAGKSRVKISFLAHSLGCSITTNALRVLSDVFASSREIGRALVLDRLVLVAPDIPVESVIPRRSNVLVSALRRVGEVHVFTNEGDLALRLASTAANYFSFPARSRFSGYRLGNLTLKHFHNARDRRGTRPRYGVVGATSAEEILPSRFLEIRASSGEHRHLWEKPFFPWVANGPKDVTNRISYYDCTDYIDVLDSVDPGTASPRGVVSKAIKAPALNLPAYFLLLLAYLQGPARGGVDTHGGYFHGRTSKEWIYTLAFAGFAELLRSTGPDLHAVADRHQVQILLSCAQKRAYDNHRQGNHRQGKGGGHHPDPAAYVVVDGQLFVEVNQVRVPCRGEWSTQSTHGGSLLVLDGRATDYVATEQDPCVFRQRPGSA
jgi:hypothetical protein